MAVVRALPESAQSAPIGGGRVACPRKHERVVAESESTDRRPRCGVVKEVLRGDPSPRYRIRWDDGHESIYTPASGALRAEQRAKRQRQVAPRKR
jgi:hypothetical protein